MVKKFLKRVRPYSTEICIFFVFMLLSVAAIYPLVFGMASTLYQGNIKSGFSSNDAKGGIACLWWIKYAWSHGIWWRLTSFRAGPFGEGVIHPITQPGFEYPAFILTLISGEVFAHNFLTLISFPLSAITMYYLACYLTESKLSAAIAGFIYAFSSFHILQSYSHLGLLLIQWMPLYILFLFKFNEKKSYLNMLGLAFSFTLVTLSSYYYGYFMVVLTVVFLLFKIMYRYSIGTKSDLSFHVLKLAALGALLIFLAVIPFVANVFLHPTSKAVPMEGVSVPQALKLSATWWSYLLPSFENPLLGHHVKNFLYSQMSGNPADQIFYLGYTPIALAVLALFQWIGSRKREFGSKERFSVPFFLFLALVALLLSLPPHVHIGRFELSMPSSFTYSFLPMFRQPGRFGILVILAVGLLAGVGLNCLVRRANFKRGLGITFLVGLLIVAEFANIPPLRTVDISKVPSVYSWLSTKPGSFVIAEYPFLGESDPRQQDFRFYQRIHEKRLLMGFPGNARASRSLSYLDNLADPNVPPILSYLGVKYVIVHTDLYRSNEGTIPRIPDGQALQYGTAGQGLVFVKSFPGALVYEVKTEPQKVLWLRYKNFYPSETWRDGREWNWASSSEAEVVAVNYTGRELPCDIRFLAASLGKSCSLKVLLNGEEVKKVIVESAPEVTEIVLTEVILKDVRLQSGENSIMLCADLPAEKIDTYLHNGSAIPEDLRSEGDVREATFAVADFGIGN